MRMNRRNLLITAACAIAAGSGPASASEYVWRGFAMGADAEIRISGLAERDAQRIAAIASGEIDRLEAIFSLYRPDSELARANRMGGIDGPSQDFRLLLSRSLEYWRQTGGRFNPAIQPVWAYLAQHFAQSSAEPGADELKHHLAACDPGRISIAEDRISLATGMALTFNGIAQGYVTDRVADLLRGEGLADVLINLGEIRALPGRAWPIGVSGQTERIELRNGAIAQSAGRGTRFTADGLWHHLIDPGSGRSAQGTAALTVAAATATEADALSTALYVSNASQRAAIAARFPHIRFWIEPSA